MKVLMLSTDKNILSDGSKARERILEYGKLAEELHIIVKNQNPLIENQKIGNVFIYPTNFSNRWIYFFAVLKIGKKILASEGEWLITSQDPFENGFLGYQLKKKFNLPLQLQVHTDFLSPYFWRQSLLNKIRVRLAKFLLPKADSIRVVSERIKKSLISQFPNLRISKIVVLSIFTDVKKIQEAVIKNDLQKKYPQFEFIILMTSRLTREKNISLALRAMISVIKKHPKTGLIIVGDGPERDNLKLKAENLKLTGNVVIEPWLDDPISYYKSADLFLLTSNYEGWGMAVVEAIAAGRPVAMTDVGCAGELLHNGENGVVVPVGDETALSSAISQLLENPELRQRFRYKNLEVVKNLKDKEDYLNDYKKSWEICR